MENKKTVSERLSALVMAGVMASTLGMPALAFADNDNATPSAGEQTGTGATNMTMIQQIDPDQESGGTEDPDSNYLSFTVPTSINFVLAADGTLTGPDTGNFIENRSAMPIHASSLKVDQATDWNIVADAAYDGSNGNNVVDVAMKPLVTAPSTYGTSENLSKFVTGDNARETFAAPAEWNMTATDGASGTTASGTDTKTIALNGKAKNINKDITTPQTFGTIHWYMKGGSATA